MIVAYPSRELEAAYREQRPPRLGDASVGGWASAINGFLISGQLSIAEHALRHLRDTYPAMPYARNLCGIFDRIPEPDPTQASFEDDASKDVQVIARNSDAVILLFSGKLGGLGLPIPMIHRWFARLPASLIYLRDSTRTHYLQGVQSLAPTREATLHALRPIIASLHARRVLCYGNCAGVFASLDYGLGLQADAVLCVSGRTNLTPDANMHTPYEPTALALKAQFPDACLDMLEAYSRAAKPPRVCIVYGKSFWDDRIQAEDMETLSCVTAYGLDGCAEHNLIGALISRGEFEELLDWLIHPPKLQRGVSTPRQKQGL
jgi:hypothetical protein